MDFSKILPAVAALAPTIASALGTPLAGMGVAALEQAFGLLPGTAKADPKALEAAVLGMTPDQAIALRKADQDFAIRAKELDLDFEKIRAADRDSARKREVDTKDWTPRALAFAVTVGFFGLLALAAFHALPDTNKDMFNIMLGSLGAAVTAVTSYYFGSSAGSARKDDTIKALSA